jgi:hypothetical protein
LAQQKIDNGRNFFRSSKPLHGQSVFIPAKSFLPFGFRATGADQWCVNRTWADRLLTVDPTTKVIERTPAAESP